MPWPSGILGGGLKAAAFSLGQTAPPRFCPGKADASENPEVLGAEPPQPKPHFQSAKVDL